MSYITITLNRRCKVLTQLTFLSINGMKKGGKMLQKGVDRKWLAYSKLKTMMRKIRS